MKQKKRMTLFIGTAFLALVAILAWPSREKAPQVQPVFDASQSLAALSGTPPPSPISLALAAQRERSASLTWGRDLFQGPSTPQTKQPFPRRPDPVQPLADQELPRLSGLCRVGEFPMAIIGREIVQRGDRLSSGYQVTEIADGRVTLTRGEETVVLSLGKDR